MCQEYYFGKYPSLLYETIIFSYFDVLLTVHLNIILVINQHNAQILVL